MCTKIDKIHYSINSTYYGTIHLRENIIQACRGHLALVIGLTNSPPKTSAIVNFLCNSIINYKVVHKPNLIRSYAQSENDFDDKMFFINH